MSLFDITQSDTDLNLFRRVDRDKRSAKRREQVHHLWACGPRAVQEALLDVAGGRNLDVTLAGFCRFPPEFYRAVLRHYANEEGSR